MKFKSKKIKVILSILQLYLGKDHAIIAAEIAKKIAKRDLRTTDALLALLDEGAGESQTP